MVTRIEVTVRPASEDMRTLTRRWYWTVALVGTDPRSWPVGSRHTIDGGYTITRAGAEDSATACAQACRDAARQRHA